MHCTKQGRLSSDIGTHTHGAAWLPSGPPAALLAKMMIPASAVRLAPVVRVLRPAVLHHCPVALRAVLRNIWPQPTLYHIEQHLHDAEDLWPYPFGRSPLPSLKQATFLVLQTL
jgi:hypothetical protein